jgi:hypothetical protein
MDWFEDLFKHSRALIGAIFKAFLDCYRSVIVVEEPVGDVR